MTRLENHLPSGLPLKDPGDQSGRRRYSTDDGKWYTAREAGEVLDTANHRWDTYRGSKPTKRNKRS